jgi:predicted TIM-barrel enzyme
MGYALEVEMVRLAREAGMLAAPYCFTPDEAAAMAGAGADIVVAHMGLTTGGSIGAGTAMNLDDAVVRVQAIRDAAVATSADVVVLCHGGPISSPADVAHVMASTRGVAGFFGASTVERLPTETAIRDVVRALKAVDPGGASRP